MIFSHLTVLQISCREYIYSEQNRKILGWRGVGTHLAKEVSVRVWTDLTFLFVFPHKVAPSQKCSVTVSGTLIFTLSPMIFSSSFPGSPTPRKSQSLFWISFRVVHICSNLSRPATTILVKKTLNIWLNYCPGFPYFPSVPPPDATVYHIPFRFPRTGFSCWATTLIRSLHSFPTI